MSSQWIIMQIPLPVLIAVVLLLCLVGIFSEAIKQRFGRFSHKPEVTGRDASLMADTDLTQSVVEDTSNGDSEVSVAEAVADGNEILAAITAAVAMMLSADRQTVGAAGSVDFTVKRVRRMSTAWSRAGREEQLSSRF